jgi:hypothetical protein
MINQEMIEGSGKGLGEGVNSSQFGDKAKRGTALGVIFALCSSFMVFNFYFGGCEGLFNMGGYDGQGLGGATNGIYEAVGARSQFKPKSKEIDYSDVGTMAQTSSNEQGFYQEQCLKLTKFRNYIIEAAATFSKPESPISPQLIAGILSRESNVGAALQLQKPGDTDKCSGRGDPRIDPVSNNQIYFGFGLGQLDANSAEGKRIGPDGQFIINDKQAQIKGQWYNWFDCKGGIMVLASKLAGKMDLVTSRKKIIENLKAEGVDDSRNADKSFKDYRMTRGIVLASVNAYNAGNGPIINWVCKVNKDGKTDDSCTTNGNYSTDVYKRARLYAKCLGLPDTEKAIINPNNYGLTTQANILTSDDRCVALNSKNPNAKINGVWSKQFAEFVKMYTGVKDGSNPYFAFNNGEIVGNTNTIGIHGPSGAYTEETGQAVAVPKQWGKFIGALDSDGVAWKCEANLTNTTANCAVPTFEEAKANIKNNSFLNPKFKDQVEITIIDKYEDMEVGDVVFYNIYEQKVYKYKYVPKGETTAKEVDIIVPTGTGVFSKYGDPKLIAERDKCIIFSQNPNPPAMNEINKNKWVGAIRYTKAPGQNR